MRELLGARDANGTPLMTYDVFSTADSMGRNAFNSSKGSIKRASGSCLVSSCLRVAKIKGVIDH